MTYVVFPSDEFSSFTKQLIGLVVALPWKGYGSAIFLELGALTRSKSNRQNHARGEACICLEWDWRVEYETSVLYGSSNSGPRIAHGIASLQGVKVQAIAITGKVPELVISFSNGQSLRSMAMVTGDPVWSIKLLDKRWVFPLSGELHVGDGETGNLNDENLALTQAADAAKRWGTPCVEPVKGHCSLCKWFVPIDGEGCLLDYGVCTSSESLLDGRVVNSASGCPGYDDK